MIATQLKYSAGTVVTMKPQLPCVSHPAASRLIFLRKHAALALTVLTRRLAAPAFTLFVFAWPIFFRGYAAPDLARDQVAMPTYSLRGHR
jgi:hypothetical protein